MRQARQEQIVAAWVRSQTQDELIELMRGENMRGKVEILSLCLPYVQDSMIEYLTQSEDPELYFDKNEYVAMKYFSLEALKIEKINDESNQSRDRD